MFFLRKQIMIIRIAIPMTVIGTKTEIRIIVVELDDS